MDFLIDDRRVFQRTTIGIRLFMFIFDIFCIISSYNSIEKDGIFIHYCSTIAAVFFSILNSIRFEYNYWEAYGRSFLTLQDYKIWKQQNLKNLKYIFGTIEYIFKITFFYHSFPIKDLRLYSISILLLQLNIGLFIIFVKLCIIYWIYLAGMILYNLIKNPKKFKQKINKECSICCDINTKYWIKTMCNHEFHDDCLKKWKVISMTCPICRNMIE